MLRRRFLVPLAVVLLLFSFYQVYFTGTFFNRVRYGVLSDMAEILDLADSYYVDKIDKKTCQEKILKSGLEACLDKNSHYFTAAEVPEVWNQIAGSFGGVGIEIDKKDEFIQVIAPVDDTPAAKAGIMTGDIIVAVNGVTTRGMNLADFVKKVKGRPGTSVTLTVERGKEKPKDILLVREVIRVISVKSSFASPRLGYIRITQFTERSAANLAIELRRFGLFEKIGLEKTVDGLIIDLRGNPGGLLQEVWESLKLLQPKNKKLVITEKGLNMQRVYKEDSIVGYNINDNQNDNIPIVVLINGGSASASEIMAGTLKLWGYSVVGEKKSYGKGTVQRALIPLSSGAALNLTVARYYLGEEQVPVDGIGISSDYEVKWQKAHEQSDDDFTAEYRKNFGNPASDPQLEKGIEVLRERIKSYKQ